MYRVVDSLAAVVGATEARGGVEIRVDLKFVPNEVTDGKDPKVLCMAIVIAGPSLERVFYAERSDPSSRRRVFASIHLAVQDGAHHAAAGREWRLPGSPTPI